jgi:hypothetical protein
MKHDRDRYDYYIEIGRHLGIKITTPNDLRKNLSRIPELDLKDLRKLDNLKMILDYLETNKS